MLSVVTSGVPISARDILSDAINLAFGSDVVEFIELNKDSLRSRVRLSRKDVSVILVILDGVSSDLCKDIEGGLYSSDKYHTYVDDADLVRFLNSKYGLDMEIPIEESQNILEYPEDSDVSSELIERYEAQLRDRDLMIESLNGRIEELSELIDTEDFSGLSQEDYDELSSKLEDCYSENLVLKSKVSDLENSISEKQNLLEVLKNEKEELRSTVRKLEESKKSLLSNYRSVNDELTNLRVENSKQVGLLESRAHEIKVLNEKLKRTEKLEETVASLEEGISARDITIKNLTGKISDLNVDMSSQSKELDRLREEVRQNGVSNDLLESMKGDITSLTQERDTLLKGISAKESERSSLSEQLEKAELTVQELKGEVVRLEENIKEYDTNLTTLNSDKLRLQGELRVLKQSTDRDIDVERVSSELVDLRKKYDTLSSNVFSRISSLAMPKNSSAVYLTRRGVQLENIRFVFAGSTESRKGAYRCLLNEFRMLSSSEKVLIVDVVSETSIDYVFEIQSIVNGLEWFRKGGGVQPYLSKTCLRNVKVLSPGLGYINDSYFLTVDWESRISELENSGYKVVLFCGDISNIVGRVMHESFADLGQSYIYVHGNAIGSRTVVSNLKGLSNAKSSIVAYYDFNSNMKRFYDMVAKNNKCVLLSIRKG